MPDVPARRRHEDGRMPSLPRTLRRAALAAAVGIALLPAAASADSLVFVKDHNVWLADGNGAGLHQVTKDGSASFPYRSPTQADDGTIAASFKQSIVRLRQNGELITAIDPPALTNSVSHPMDGTPVDVAISPDGSKIAYTFADFSCPVGASCGARTATGYVTAAGAPLPGNLYLSNPSWAGNARTLLFGGFLHQVNVHDQGAAEDVHWFDDREVVGPEYESTDLGDGELSRQGDKLALIRGYGDDAHVMWYTVAGNALSGPPPENPAMLCATGKLAGLHGPTWAPDGQALAWGEPDGIWIKRDVMSCTTPQPTLAIAGGSEPHWGPADVRPGPLAGGPGPGPGTTGTGATAPGGAKLKLTVGKATPRKIARKGLRLSVPCAGACTVKATVKVSRAVARSLALGRSRRLAARTVTLRRAGTAVLRLKPGRKAATRLAKLRRVKLTVRATVTPARGPKQTLKRVVTA
jgi:hypothetical protein